MSRVTVFEDVIPRPGHDDRNNDVNIENPPPDLEYQRNVFIQGGNANNINGERILNGDMDENRIRCQAYNLRRQVRVPERDD